MANEYDLHLQVTEYLKAQYPDVVFRTDMAGIKLSIGAAVKAAKLQCTKAYPDLFIAEPRGEWHGLFIELKLEPIRKRNGEFKTEHIQEQAWMIRALRERGYMADFAVGLDEAMALIDRYLAQ